MDIQHLFRVRVNETDEPLYIVCGGFAEAKQLIERDGYTLRLPDAMKHIKEIDSIAFTHIVSGSNAITHGRYQYTLKEVLHDTPNH